MTPGTQLLVIAALVLGAAALFALVRWLERVTRVAGLSPLIVGVTMLIGVGIGLWAGQILLPILFAFQAIVFLSQAYSHHHAARRTHRKTDVSGDS